jgi:ornithine cyclodeaminase/alanine dehydrogenase-like protein (mu-crystallin family)
MGNGSIGTLLLSRGDVERLLTPEACLAAVEDAFRQHALGRIPPPGILGVHAEDGSFHVKAAQLVAGRPCFAAKINANFPRNGTRHGRPTIQGVVVLFDAANGAPLAVMDSMSITALRTAAATAVAAKHLAREDCDALLICGCGAQAPAQLRALLRVRRPRRILAYDLDEAKVGEFIRLFRDEKSIVPVASPQQAMRESDIIVTCTTAKRWFVGRDVVRPGAFVAGVGADNDDKQELDPQLLAAAKVVTDLTAQCAVIGDLHHALAAGALSRADVHAELGEIVAGLKPARENDSEIIVFDSTGTALQDVAAAALVYERAAGAAETFNFT